MIDWLGVFKHLLPNARAWRITVNKNLRRFFDSLTPLGEDVKTFFDGVFQDLDPQLTRELDAWEDQFALPGSLLTEQQRRDRLDAAWKNFGGQDPRHIEDTLRAAGFDVYVHEWWEEPDQGSVKGIVTPTARNPFEFLWDGSAPRQYAGAGHNLAYCGGTEAYANSQLDPPGYPLVNKVQTVSITSIGCGHDVMYAGGFNAAAGVDTVVYSQKQYEIPADETKYPYFLYIGGQTFPEVASVSANRQDEFEDLCLKICPTEQWLGILVEYS